MRRAAVLLLQQSQPLVAQAVQQGRAVPAAAHQFAASLQSVDGTFSSVQPRWSHCSCSGDLSLPPPQKVLVEYSPAEVDAFIEFADACEEEFQGIMVDGVEVDGPSHLFDIKLEDGQLVFSRAAEGSTTPTLPAYSDLFARLRSAGLQAAAA